MMTGYRNRNEETAAAEWFDAAGQRFIRTGDIGRFDEDGFLSIVDRKKDVVISGGFNIYTSDLEAIVAQHPDVQEVAVVAMPSTQWGETPFAFVVVKPGVLLDGEVLLRWANERLGRMQKLSGVRLVEALPRSPIGKVLKRELRERL
jgi:acyl-CoA synthetase (AMP-forming)/AMP-acid ligase II